MEVIDELIKRLDEYGRQLPELAAEVLNENETLIVDMNIAQLQRGQRSDGEILPDYSPVSVAVYGKPPGPIRLFDTGAFYRGINARANPKALEMDNTDSKRGMLSMRYGDEIVGLTEENIVVLQESILLPGLIDKSELLLLQ